MTKIRIPVGEENFEFLRKKKSYYVDKTRFIAELLDEDFKVKLQKIKIKIKKRVKKLIKFF